LFTYTQGCAGASTLFEGCLVWIAASLSHRERVSASEGEGGAEDLPLLALQAFNECLTVCAGAREAALQCGEALALLRGVASRGSEGERRDDAPTAAALAHDFIALIAQ
jgi:hypothetical protein